MAPQKPPPPNPSALGRLGGEHPVTGSDMQPSTPPRGKIGPCHTSKWDPATSRGIGAPHQWWMRCKNELSNAQEINAGFDETQTRNKSNNETMAQFLRFLLKRVWKKKLSQLNSELASSQMNSFACHSSSSDLNRLTLKTTRQLKTCHHQDLVVFLP